MGDGLSEVALISRAQSEPDSLRLPLFSLLTLIQMAGFGVGMLVVRPFCVGGHDDMAGLRCLPECQIDKPLKCSCRNSTQALSLPE